MLSSRMISCGVTDFNVERSRAGYSVVQDGMIASCSSNEWNEEAPTSLREAFDWLSMPTDKAYSTAVDLSSTRIALVLQSVTNPERKTVVAHTIGQTCVHVIPTLYIERTLVDFTDSEEAQIVEIGDNLGMRRAFTEIDASHVSAIIELKQRSRLASHWEHYTRIAMRCLGMTKAQHEEYMADDRRYPYITAPAYRIADAVEGRSLADLNVEIDAYINQRAQEKHSCGLYNLSSIMGEAQHKKWDTWDTIGRNAYRILSGK